MPYMSSDLSQVSDASLIVSIGRYKHAALAEAYRRHGAAVYNLARRLLGNPAVAEEVAQEVFLRLWQQPERYDPERGALRSFLFRECHSRSVDVIRSDSARRAREDRDARKTANAGYDLEHEVWDLAVAERLQAAMATLEEGPRRAITLAYFGGLTYREVAAELGEPEGTVKSWIRRSLHRLRDELESAGIGGR
jgi:RNA polymerase sigma-70 factor (ECF subfamily)